MKSGIVRRTVVAIASTAIAAAGLLVTGGTASAATHPSSTQPGAVSTVRITDRHDGDRHGAFGGRGPWQQDRDGGRHRIRHDDRHGYQARIDEERRQWVLDQIRWAEDHGYTYWGSLEHHDRSHR
ncbi:hypothetical protein [Streptomyces sp. NBC_01618]|uniref:hypothetical protein n=1 Tax=Streptomyces sp. NBC_01618 TaxID=2975900 RepID=UPI0038635849|nr:hypothetical protein OH735_37995 [Streptomyces sp. NBC_01618]